MDIDYVNKRITNEFCCNIVTKLNDEQLSDEYKEFTYIKNKIEILKIF